MAAAARQLQVLLPSTARAHGPSPLPPRVENIVLATNLTDTGAALAADYGGAIDVLEVLQVGARVCMCVPEVHVCA